MERIVPVQVDGVDLWVETVVLPGSEPTSGGLGKAGERVIEGFAAAQEAIGVIARRVAGTVAELSGQAVCPDKLQVEFGLSFTATGHILVAGSSAGTSLKVSVTYDRPAGPTAGVAQPSLPAQA
ncbi:MAG: CU044_2847 family protein [Candidatus Nanopelagicales bacterium]